MKGEKKLKVKDEFINRIRSKEPLELASKIVYNGVIKECHPEEEDLINISLEDFNKNVIIINKETVIVDRGFYQNKSFNITG